MIWALVAVAMLGAAPAKKKAVRKADPAAAATDAAIKRALDDQQQKIADCVVADAPPGTWAKTVKATVKINSAGQVLAADVTLEPEGPVSTKECVEKVLRAVAYPRSAGPLISISRDWSFAMK